MSFIGYKTDDSENGKCGEVINVQKYSYLNLNPKYFIFSNSSHEHSNSVPFSPSSHSGGPQRDVNSQGCISHALFSQALESLMLTLEGIAMLEECNDLW